MLRAMALLVGATALATGACGADGTSVTVDGDGRAPGDPDAEPPVDSDGDARRAPPVDMAPSTGPTMLRLRTRDSKTLQLIPAVVAMFDATTGKWLNFGERTDRDTPSMGATLIERGGALMSWHGVMVWRGDAVIPVGVDWDVRSPGVSRKERLPFGRWRLIASRGIEYELAEAVVDLQPNRGEVVVDLRLAHTVDTTGYLAADMHVHSAGSVDSRISAKDRLKSMTVNGVEVVVATDHDATTDLGEAARELWPSPDVAPLATIVGTESSFATGGTGHFNAFPLVFDRQQPRNGAPDPYKVPARSSQYFDFLRALPGNPVVQMNHTRLSGYLGYFSAPLCGPWNDRSKLPICSVNFEAMEVLAGYMVCGGFIAQQLADWYALLNFGVLVAATGNSDTHGTVNLLGGYPRTYVRLPDDNVTMFSRDEFMAALRGRRAIATSGPFLSLRVNDRHGEGALFTDTGGRVTVKLRMQAASWILVDEVRLLVNGETIKSWPVPRVGDASPLFEVSDEFIELKADGFITAEVIGKKPLPPWLVGEWNDAVPGSCPPAPGADNGFTPFAVTNPVFVDVDGDGRFTAPRQPAVMPTPPN